METSTGDDKSSKHKLEDVKDTEPELLKSTFLDTVGESYKKRTIIIDPFTPDLLSEDTLQKWVPESKEFYIRKTWTGKSMALLSFDSPGKGENALTELRAKLAAKSETPINVVHPTCTNTLDNFSRHLYMDQALGIDQMEEQSVLSRQIILEGVPNSLSMDRIQKTFPQSISMLDFRDEPECGGTVTVEFGTTEDVQKLLSSQPEITIDGAKISVFAFDSEVCKRYKNGVQALTNTTEQFKALNDDLRIDMCKAHKALEEERFKLFNRTDIFSQEKKSENARICALMKPYREHLIADTKRRLESGEKTLPEGNCIIAPVAEIILEESKKYFTLIPEEISPRMKELVEKAAQKATMKLSVLEKVRAVADERKKIALEVAQLPKMKALHQSTQQEDAKQMSTPMAGSSSQNRGKTPHAPRGGYSAGRGGGHADWRSRGSFKPASQGRGRDRPAYDYDEPYGKRFRGSGGGGRGNEQKSITEIQAVLEERLRKLEEMQLQTIQVQSKMLLNQAANMNKDS